MAKDPVLPLYYNDIDRSTKTWSDEEFGAYVRLLMEQWDKGGLPKDYQRLSRICTSLDRNWDLLKTKFVEVDGQLKNLVLEDHREKRRRHKEKQKENIQKRYQTSTKHITKTLPLENENEKEKEKEKEKEIQIGGVGERLSVALDELYLDGMRKNWSSRVDFDFELQTFSEKVRGSPEHYAAHDTAGIRLAFQHQLRNAKKNGTNIGTNKGNSSTASSRGFSGIYEDRI